MREKFNPHMHEIEISPIVKISEEVRDRAPIFKKEAGKEFILFQRGEIDFKTPEKITGAIKNALDEGKTKYPKAGGEPGPKKSLLEKLEEFNKIKDLDPDNIVLAYGGQEALQLSFQLFAGKKACGFSPIWSVLLENFIPYSGISFSEVPLNEDFSIEYAKLENTIEQSDVFYINNPHNPTGKIFSEEELSQIGEICKKYGVFIISDEAYEHIVFDNKNHVSIASLSELYDYQDIITAFTFSKTFSMTGLRLGYAVSRNKIAVDLIRKADYTQTAGVVTPIQESALVGFSGLVMDEVEERVGELQKRRDVLYEGLQEIKGLEVVKPEGAFYFFPDFSKFVPRDLKGKERDWYIYNLCLENGVAIVPGCCFSKEGYFPDNARLSFSATPPEKIIEGVARIRAFLE